METKIFNGVLIYRDNPNDRWACDFDEYIKTRKLQGKKWSEKSFCDWCDKYNFDAIG